MKNTVILLAMFLLGCSSNKQIQLERSMTVNDSLYIERIDSTSIHNVVNDVLDYDENVETVIEEEINETVVDSSNDVVIERRIRRTISQTSGKSISSEIEVIDDTTSIIEEKTLDIKDNETIQLYNEDKKESNKLKYICWIVLMILIGYIIYKFKK